MNAKGVLILDDEVDFCLLMSFYLSKRNLTVYYAHTLSDGLEIIETKRPDLIITDKEFTGNVEKALHAKIDSMEDTYDPEIWPISSQKPPSIISQTLTEQGDMGDEIKKLIRWILNKFKR